MGDEINSQDQSLDGQQSDAQATGQHPEPGDGGAATGQPSTLDAAFKQLRDADSGRTETNVGEQSTGNDADNGTDNSADGGPATTVQSNAGAAPTAQPAARPSTQPTQQQRQFDINDLYKSFEQQAIRKANSDFAAHEIGKLSLGDLYQRDERTGRVTFYNQDDPDHPFTSRVEAQQFVDAFNKNVVDEAQAYAANVYQNLIEENKDIINMLEFAPTYNAMSPEQQHAFESLIAPYEQKNANGQTVFPDVDFRKMAQQAINVAALYGQPKQQQNQQQQQQKQAAQPSPKQSGPALDMPSGAGASTYDAPPKTMAEAIKRVNEQRAASRKKNKK